MTRVCITATIVLDDPGESRVRTSAVARHVSRLFEALPVPGKSGVESMTLDVREVAAPHIEVRHSSNPLDPDELERIKQQWKRARNRV